MLTQRRRDAVVSLTLAKPYAHGKWFDKLTMTNSLFAPLRLCEKQKFKKL